MNEKLNLMKPSS